MMKLPTFVVWSFAMTYLALGAEAGSAAANAPNARIDHLILGVADLDRAIEDLEKLTGVRPVYGGKHPTGTHNALVSLGDRVYLELIAVQPGATPPPLFAALSGLEKTAPIGWAVSADDGPALRHSLESAGFKLTELRPGSRTTSSGTTLQWQTFGLAPNVRDAPFFILWGAETPHPSVTSPAGCTLERLALAGPQIEDLKRLRDALGLSVEVAQGAKAGLTFTLKCPKGVVTFEPG
jgi:catechol 2,3-dioxygenase-like lactoylglutathione lyase family enzyme